MPRRAEGSCGGLGFVGVFKDRCDPGWKSEKLILRNGATWKVRDKKVRTLNRKKTKLGLVAKLVNEKEKEQPLADPKDLAEDELLASLVEVRISENWFYSLYKLGERH
ncbi:unnamed protein product [Musa hybrid cultivar]